MKNPLFAFGNCLRHAFMAGAGYEKEFEEIAVADLDRWTHYDPPNVGSFKTMADVIAAAGREEASETMVLHPNVFGRYTTGKVPPIVANIEEFEKAMERANKAIRDFVPVQRTTTGVVIVAAAVRVAGKFVLSVPAPGRHHDIINAGIFPMNNAFTEGFLTSAGTFVDRENALELAVKAGQYNAPAAGKRELFSEDLW
jgi:hypothetical protein